MGDSNLWLPCEVGGSLVELNPYLICGVCANSWVVIWISVCREMDNFWVWKIHTFGDRSVVGRGTSFHLVTNSTNGYQALYSSQNLIHLLEVRQKQKHKMVYTQKLHDTDYEWRSHVEEGRNTGEIRPVGRVWRTRNLSPAFSKILDNPRKKEGFYRKKGRTWPEKKVV